MAAFKKYYGKNLKIRFFPNTGENNESIIYLEPKKGVTKQAVRKIKEKIETLLNVSDSSFNIKNGRPIFTIKLAKNVKSNNVEELLKSMFHGGETENDAFSIDVNQNETQLEHLQTHIFSILLESTYRTGDYWKILSRSSGKPIQSITKDDILSLRKQYTKKPTSKKRNEVLRALDKAMRYFVRKIKKENLEEAEKFRKEYRSIGNLTPSDYKEDSHVKPEKKDTKSFDNNFNEPSINISDLFDFSEKRKQKRQKDAYERFEIER